MVTAAGKTRKTMKTMETTTPWTLYDFVTQSGLENILFRKTPVIQVKKRHVPRFDASNSTTGNTIDDLNDTSLPDTIEDDIIALDDGYEVNDVDSESEPEHTLFYGDDDDNDNDDNNDDDDDGDDNDDDNIVVNELDD